MNPSPQAVALIRAHVTDWTPPDATIVASLNAPAVANPTPQAAVARPFAFADVMGLLSPASVANVRSLPTGVDVIDKINAQDRLGIAHWIAALQAPPALITPDEAAAVMGVIQATQPDPAWAAQISWAVSVLGRPVDTADIAASRPGA